MSTSKSLIPALAFVALLQACAGNTVNPDLVDVQGKLDFHSNIKQGRFQRFYFNSSRYRGLSYHFDNSSLNRGKWYPMNAVSLYGENRHYRVVLRHIYEPHNIYANFQLYDGEYLLENEYRELPRASDIIDVSWSGGHLIASIGKEEFFYMLPFAIKEFAINNSSIETHGSVAFKPLPKSVVELKVPKSFEESLESARNNDNEAQWLVAKKFLEDGEIGSLEDKQGRFWLERAAENNNLEALTEVCFAKMNGAYGIERNFSEGLEVCARVAAIGEPLAAINLIDYYRYEAGKVPMDEKINHWLREAVLLQSRGSVVELAFRTIEGVGREKNELLGRTILKTATANGITPKHYLTEHETYFSTNPTARQIASSIGQQVVAYEDLPEALYNSGTNVMELFVSGVKEGIELAGLQVTGEADFFEELVFGLIRVSAELGHSGAQELYSDLHARGFGVSKSSHRSKYWSDRARKTRK